MTSSDAIESLKVNKLSLINYNSEVSRPPSNYELMAKLNELIEKFNYLVEVVSNGNTQYKK